MCNIFKIGPRYEYVPGRNCVSFYRLGLISFQAAVTSILLYVCTTWTLTKRLEKKLDGNYTRMLRAILNKSWRQHPTRHHLYGHLPPITKTIQVRRTRHAGHCWRSRDELIRDVLLWTPTRGRARAGRPARTYIQQLCEDTGCCPEDLPRAMNDKEEWRDRVMDIRATSAIWWWWWWWWICEIYIGNPEIRNTDDTLGSGTKLLLSSLSLCFSTRGERDTIFLSSLFVHRQLSTHWPNQRVRAPCSPHCTGFAQVRKIHSPCLSPNLNSLLLFKITKNPSPSLPGMTSFTSPILFPIWGFYCDICDYYTLPARAWKPALMFTPTHALSLTKPKDKIYKTKNDNITKKILPQLYNKCIKIFHNHSKHFSDRSIRLIARTPNRE